MKARETLEKMLDLTRGQGDKVNIDTIKDVEELKGHKMTCLEAILLAQIERAITTGDRGSAEFIFKMTGDFNEHNVVDLKADNPFVALTTKELQNIASLNSKTIEEFEEQRDKIG